MGQGGISSLTCIPTGAGSLHHPSSSSAPPDRAEQPGSFPWALSEPGKGHHPQEHPESSGVPWPNLPGGDKAWQPRGKSTTSDENTIFIRVQYVARVCRKSVCNHPVLKTNDKLLPRHKPLPFFPRTPRQLFVALLFFPLARFPFLPGSPTHVASQGSDSGRS